MKMKNQLPEHVVDLVERESSKAASPRLFKTQIINKLFRRTASGRLELNLDDPLFSEHQKLYSKKFSKEKETALPEKVMCGLYFGNSENAMNDAKRDGSIYSVEGEDKRRRTNSGLQQEGLQRASQAALRVLQQCALDLELHCQGCECP